MNNDEKTKKIKDPLYGYIEIEAMMIKYIDTPEFQRLRNIRQTGYASLYPGALHNRFVHSLGVLYLGNKAIQSFRRNVEADSKKTPAVWRKWERTFQLACLLHDVGHSPFSHTGEEFYNLQSGFVDELPKRLKKKELEQKGKPHEVMSAIVGMDLIREFDDGTDIDVELFVRCIIGALYTNNEKYLYQNAIIQMLNGKVIDVDKLDYLIRDAYVTGYDSVSLDVDRLLNSYSILEDNGKKRVGYRHGALSVIENVAYANDLERRWIQTNPIILYDCKLLEHAIIEYNGYMKETYRTELADYENILCRQALSKEGIHTSTLKLKLLCDDDIIVYLKNISKSDIGKQYFNRAARLVPMWKNEIDFRKIIEDKLGNQLISKLSDEIARLTDGLGSMFFINQAVKEKLQEEQDKELEKGREDGKQKGKIEKRQNTSKNDIKMLELFEKFVEQEKLPEFQFAILSGKKYESNYKKLALEKIYVELGNNRVEQFSETLTVKSVSNNNEAKEISEEKIFYVYTSRANKECYAGKKKDICEAWAEFVNENWRKIYET